MPLNKKTVVLNLAQMGNQKGDPKSLAPGTPTKVENAQFTKGNRIDKRFGYDPLRLLSVEGQYYETYYFYPNNDLDLDFRIFRQFDGNITVGIQFVFPLDGTSGQNFKDELDLRLDHAGGVFGFHDKSNVHWVITAIGNFGLSPFVSDASNYTNVTFRMRDGSTDYTTVTKDGVPSTPVDFYTEFDEYRASADFAVFTANNPSGVEYVVPVPIVNLQGVVGTPDHLLLHADDKVHSYSETLDKFEEIGPYRPAEITIDSIDETGSPLMSADCLHAGGVTYYAYLEFFDATSAFQFLSAVDEENGEHLFGPLNPVDFGGSGSNLLATIRLFLFNGQPYIFYSDGGGAFRLRARKISPTGFGPEVLLASGSTNASAPGANSWDVLNFNDQRIVIAYSASTVDITTRYFDEDLVELTAPYDVKTYSTLSAFADQIAMSMSSSGDRFFAFASDGAPDGIEYLLIGSTANTLIAMTVLGIDVVPFQLNAGGIGVVPNPENLDGVDGVRGYYDPNQNIYGTAQYGFGKGTIRWHISDGGVLVDPNDDYQFFGFEVISKPWLYDGKQFYLLYRSAENNNCYYIGSWDESSGEPNLIITAQFLYGRAPDGFSIYRPVMFGTNFTEISPGVARVSVISKDSIASVPGIVSVKVDFTSKDKFSSVPYGRSMLLAGSNLHSFCGTYLRELNFFYSSRELRLAELSSGGYISEGLYSVVVVYEFTDRNGYLHRSSPSVPVSITTQAGDVNSIQYVAETYNVTNSTGSGGDVAIIAYRTVKNGSIYYRDDYYEKSEDGAEPANPTNQVNFAFVGSTSKNLTRSDAELESREVLFTVSGEVPPTPVPPMKYLTTWGSRIWGAGSARDEAIYFSKLNQTNLMPEFSEAFSIAVQDKSGRTTGIAGLTDKIVMSKRGRLFYSFGQGPNNLGAGPSFSKFEEISGVSGAVSGRSMVVNGAGLNYKSDKGVYTLSPGLQTVFSGAAYEDEVDEEILQAITPIDSETIRYVTASGILAYNNFFNAWSKDSSSKLQPVDACLYDNRFHVMTADSLLVENLTKWTDDTDTYDMLIETGWTSFAGIAGFQRFYKLFMVMDNLTPYTVTVSLAYDYGPYVDFTTFTDVTDSRIIIYPSKQKCEAFRMRIEVAPNGDTEQSLNINFIGIVAGVKKGLPKQLPVSQRIGVTTI
jgi:hypothetical protein